MPIAHCIVNTSRNMKLIKPFDEQMISNERKYKNNIKRKCTFMKANNLMIIVQASNGQLKKKKKRIEWNDEKVDCLIVTKHLYFH